MEKTAKVILKYIKNGHTNIELKENFKGNYYSYFNDTIYIAKDFQNSKSQQDAKSINKKAAELIVTCHECIHSVQRKYLHILNTIFSNLSIILAIVFVIIAIFGNGCLWFKVLVCSIITLNIIVRLILEIGAVNGSTKLAKDVVSKNIVSDVSQQDIIESIQFINKHKYLAFIQMILDKIILLVVILVIK